MISNGKKLRHYLVVKKLSALLRGISSKYHGVFIVWIAFFLLQQKKLEWQKKVCENKDFCDAIMLSENIKILELINIKNLIKQNLLFIRILNVW